MIKKSISTTVVPVVKKKSYASIAHHFISLKQVKSKYVPNFYVRWVNYATKSSTLKLMQEDRDEYC